MATLYLEAENLSKVIGERVLFENLTLTIAQGEKVALVARNGTGKSSLLDILGQRDDPDTGNAHIPNSVRMSYLPQNPDLPVEQTVLQTVLNSDNPMARAIRNYEEALDYQARTNTAEAAQHLQEAMDEMEAENAWDYEVKVTEILGKLNIFDHQQVVRELSGGQKKRVALAKVLIEAPDFLIMDEPTNHLDLDMVEWLEEMLSTQKMTLLLVTPDRYFLNNVTNQIVELESGQLRKFRGNFEYYLEKKAELESQQAAEVEKAQKQYAKELTWLKSQPKARGTKAKSRIDKANRLKEKAQQETSQGQVNMNVQSRRMGKKVLDLRGIHKQFDDKVVLDDFSYEFQKGDRIGIVGPNGAGKTTFLNLVTGALQPDKGERETGETIVFGYYKQEGMNLPDDKKVIEVVRDVAEVLELGNGQYLTAFQLLEQFLFPKHMHYNHVYKLSGGERRRLHLLTVLMQNPNFLILDEPTNDLDILTLGVLEDFLTNFQGCLITVTHDRYFLDKLVNHIFVFEGTGKVVDYNGTYQQYRAEKKSREQQQEKATAKASKPKKQQDQQRHQPKLSYKQQKELENLEAELQELEKRKAELQQKINAGDASPDDLQAWSEELGEIQHTITDRETRWLELAEMASFS